MQINFHSDENCRKGCHVVSSCFVRRNTPIYQHLFSVDEPGAWWENDWNCHVDGCDYPAPTKEAAIKRGMHVRGYDDFEVVEAGAFY